MLLQTRLVETDLGWIALAASARGIARSALPEPDAASAMSFIADIPVSEHDPDKNALLDDAAALLIDYCLGREVSLDRLPIDYGDASAFTLNARKACRRIPRGQTRTYGWLAEQASGSTRAARAAGRAMATNPTPIIIPCHRVLASNGHLQGFGGTVGIPLKARLLEMESAGIFSV